MKNATGSVEKLLNMYISELAFPVLFIFNKCQDIQLWRPILESQRLTSSVRITFTRKNGQRLDEKLLSLRIYVHAKYCHFSRLLKWQFSDEKKNMIFFLFLLLNIDCGYLLEPPF